MKDKTKNPYIKSPLNYTGGKHKLLPQILPLFPKDIDTFVDVFGGGFNVGINVDAKKVIYNDSMPQLKELFEWIASKDTAEAICDIEEHIKSYKLHRYKPYEEFTKEGSESYKENHKRMRADYNKSKEAMKFYSLICVSFSNQIRFNSKGDYNMPSGKRDFNYQLKQRFEEFSKKIKALNSTFMCSDFQTIDLSFIGNNDVAYFDPPYLNTFATYNEQDGWCEDREKKLYEKLDSIDANGGRFALSNVFENKGVENTRLKMWSLKYNVHYLNHSYGNCNYQAKDKSKDSTVEVLITNY